MNVARSSDSAQAKLNVEWVRRTGVMRICEIDRYS